MAEYRLDFPVSVGSVAPLAQVAVATDKIEVSATRASVRMSQLSKDVSTIAVASERTNAILLQMSAQLDRMTVSSVSASRGADAVAASVTKIGTAAHGTITDVQAASASIRALEGNLSIRAVEQFTTKVLGLGNAFQLVFPLVGGLAVVELLVKMGEKIYDLVQKWNPATQAAERYLDVMKAITNEAPNLDRGQRKLAVDAARNTAEARQKGSGAEAAARTEAGFLREDARSASITTPNGEVLTIQEAQKRMREAYLILQDNAHYVDNRLAPGPGSTWRQKAVARTDLAFYQNALDTTLEKSSIATQEAANKDLEADNLARNRREEAARKAAARSAQIKAFSRSMGKLTYEANETDPLAPFVDSYGVSIGESGRLGAGIGSGSIGKLLARRQEEVYSRGDQAFGLGGQPAGADAERQTIEAMDKLILTELQKLLRQARAELPSTDSLIGSKTSASFNLASRDYAKGLGANIRTDEQTQARELRAYDLHPELRRIESASAFRMAQLRNTGPGNERANIESAYSFRVGNANADYNDKMQSSNLRVSLAEIQKQYGDAEQRKKAETEIADARLKAFDAQAAREKDLLQARKDFEIELLELRKKNEDQFVSTAQSAYRSIVSGGAAGLAQFARGQVIGVGETIVGNAARMAYRPGAFNIPGLTGDSGIGKLLKGTALVGDGAKALTPQIKATSENTVAIQTLTATILASNGLPPSNIPGLPSIPGLATLPVFSARDPLGAVGGSFGTLSVGGGPAAFLDKMFGPGASKSVGGFASGFASVASGHALQQAFNSDYSVGTGDGRATTGSAQSGSTNGSFSTAQRVGAGIGAGTAILAGGVTAYRDFSRGNTLGGIGAIAGTVASLDPEPISKAIIGAAATVISLFGGDPKQRRADQMQKILNQNKFYDPVALNISAGSAGGGLVDYGNDGSVRGSSLSPYPMTQAPYTDFRYGVDVPGRTTGYGGFGPGGAGSNTTFNVSVSTMDAQSFNDNAGKILDAAHLALQQGTSPGFIPTIRQQLGT